MPTWRSEKAWPLAHHSRDAGRSAPHESIGTALSGKERGNHCITHAILLLSSGNDSVPEDAPPRVGFGARQGHPGGSILAFFVLYSAQKVQRTCRTWAIRTITAQETCGFFPCSSHEIVTCVVPAILAHISGSALQVMLSDKCITIPWLNINGVFQDILDRAFPV
jgi:hypothetical protein